jgi:succinate dehydrogenase/fumarate reductase flavoprotein subunit
MSENDFNLSRRKFMAVSSAAIAAPIAAPILRNMGGMVPEANAAEKKYSFVDNKSCDLVVLGGGGSGLVAAVRAAQMTGKKVIVLEKDSIAGGGAQGARTIRTFGSKWQAKRKLKDTTVEYANVMMDQVYWRLDRKTVKNCLLGTGQFIDWICEFGDNIEDKFTEGKYVLGTLDCEPVGPQMSGFGKFITDLMKEKGKTYGVEVLTNHPVVDVEVKDGKVVAAIAKSDKGYVRVACKACVLATGSWISNKEILQKYAPEFAAAKQYQGGMGGGQGGQGGPPSGQGGAPSGMGGQGGMPQMGGAEGGAPGGQVGQGGGPGGMGGMPGGQGGAPGGEGGPQGGGSSNVGHESPNYTGDGIALAEKIGAFVDYDSFCIRYMGPSTSSNSAVMMAMAISPYAISVNYDGERFCSEPVLHLGLLKGGYIQAHQPKANSFIVFDQNALAASLELQKCVKAGGKCTAVKFDDITGPPSSLPETMEEIQSDLKQNASFKADTLEELADKMGVNKMNFLETVKRYNEACKSGMDLDVFKNKEYLVPISKGPFYASKTTLSNDGAFGGVRVNPEMQAYKADRTSLVEGLYVTGDFATGRHISLDGLKVQVINDLSWAFSSGFLAGASVAGYLKKVA